MEKAFNHSALLVLIIISFSISQSEQLQSSQSQTLLRIQRLLSYPAILSSWNSSTDFCNTEPNPSLTVVCYEESISQLHIIGNKRPPRLPRNFSTDSFVTTIVKLPDLKVLTLVSLGLWGPLPGRLPEWLGTLPVLTVLSLRKNLFSGLLPNSFSNLENLRVLSLSHNHFYGEVPDFNNLTNLQVLDLEDNAFGPRFPQLGKKLVTLELSKNRFRSGIPDELSSYYQLQRLDLSFNRFIGPCPTSLLSLPSLTYFNIAKNKLTGKLFENLSCNPNLKFVDMSSNFLTGSLPKCLMLDSKKKVILYAWNCLATSDQNQHPLSFCRNEALAVGILPQKKQRQLSKAVLASGIIGGIVGIIASVGIIIFIYRRMGSRKKIKNTSTRSIMENASLGYTSKLLLDARHISQTVKVGALGLPAYRTFALEELEEATNNFDTSAFMGEGSQGQMYRGQLKDGSFVAIRSLKMEKTHSTQNFMHHIELVSKLRHRHLVSVLGHCFECYLDESSVSRMFLVFEYVPNGTLRSWISEECSRKSLTWAQRITAAIGIAKGIQFLHTGIVPGVYSNYLKITDILLDQYLAAKISSYNLPLLAKNTGKVGHAISSSRSKDPRVNARVNQEDKIDIYDFGVILLEIIVGRPLQSRNEVEVLKDQLQASFTADDAARRSIVDPAVQKTCLDQSLKTTMEVCIRCLLKEPADRPSVEDVLWNLQFAAQVQDAWRGDSQSSEGSPISPPYSHRALH